jgi:hypothetical protein
MDDWHLGWIIKLKKNTGAFSFLSFFNSQILLNLLMDDCHLSYLTKLPKKHRRQKKKIRNKKQQKAWGVYKNAKKIQEVTI